MTTGKYAANALAVGQFGGPHAARVKARSRTSHLRALATVSPIALLLGLTGPTSTASAASCTPDTTACDAAGGVTTGGDPTRGGPGGAGNGSGGAGSRFDAGTGATVINPGNPSSAGNGGAGGAGESAGGAGAGVGATNQQFVAGALNGGTGTDGPGGFNFASGGGGGGAGLYFSLSGNLNVQDTGTITGGNGGAGGAGTSGNASNGGGGGGGGAGVTAGVSGLTTNNFGSITGGNGGAGGAGGNAGGGGGGGDGYLGIGATSRLTNSGSITGGRGGNAGTGSLNNATAGDSGAGVNMVGTAGSVINNAGATITGGAANGGAAGVGVMTAGSTFISNFGTISGGLNNDGVTHAAAIRFGGTGNGLNLFAGSTIIGDIQLIPGAGATIGAVVAGQTLGNNIVLGSGSAVTFTSLNADLSVSGVISGAGSVTKTVAGTVTLSGTNTYTGGTTLSGGTLSVSSNTNLGAASGALTFNGGTLQVTGTSFTSTSRTINWGGGGFDVADAANNFTVSQSLTGNGALTKSGAGTLTLTGGNSYVGGTTVAAGTLQLGNGGSTGSVTGDVLNNGILAVNRSDTTTFAGNISGSGAFEQRGTGTTILTGTNSYGGGTTLAAGKLSVSSDANLGAAAGALTFSGGTLQVTGTSYTGTSRAINLSGGGGFEIVDAANNFVVSNNVIGNGALTKTGAGTLTLAGDVVVPGGITISAGTLQFGNGGFAGFLLSSGAIVNNGTLAINYADTVVVGNTISGTGVVEQRGTGETILSGTNTYSGGTILTAGTLSVSSDANLGAPSGALTFNGGTLRLTQPGFTSTARTINWNGGGFAVDNPTLNFTVSSSFAGVGGLTKSGSGTLTFTGNDSYTGGTTISGGTLQLGNGGTSGAITGDVLNNALLAVNRSDTYAFAGNISGNGAFQQRGSGTTILTGTNSYIGGTTISNGTLQIGNGGTSGSIAGNVVNNGRLIFNRSDDIAFTGAISGNGLFTKSGAGTLTLSGNNTYSGGTQLLGGTLAVQGGNAIGDNSSVIVLGGSTLRLLSNETVATLSSGTTDFGTVDLAGGTLATSLNSTITTAFYYGSLSGAGGFTKAGTYKQVLAGDGTYTGGTTISGGTLQLGDGGTSGSIIGNVTNNGTLAVNRSDTYTFAGNISGSGKFVQSGTGTTILTGTNIYAGGTTISAGTLQLGDGGNSGAIIGDITNNGTLAVNRSDTFSLGSVISGSGAFVQKGGGTVILTGTNSYAGGTTVSRGTLSVSSDANLGAASGVLNFNTGGTLQVTGTSFSGTARAIDLGIGGGAFEIADAANNFTLGQSITGNGSLFKLGAGTLTLTGNSSLTGGVGISGGTLQLGDGGTSGAFLGAVQLASGGLFAINRSDTIVFDSAIFGGGAFEQRGGGTTIVTSTNNYVGGTTISQGTLQLGNGGTTGSIVGDVTNNGAFAINRSDTYTFAGIVSGSGAFAQIGTGTTILTGANTYIGGTTIAAGTLQLGNGGSSGSIAGDVTNNGTFAVNRSDTFTFGGTISGSGGFAQRGTGTTILTGNNSYAGGTTLAAGTLSVSSDTNLGAASGALTFSGGTLQVTGTGFTGTSRTINWGGGGFDIVDLANNFVIGSAIAGSGALTKSGAGTLTFTGSNSYAGGTIIAAGTLQLGNGGTSGSITGDVTDNGTFAINRSDTFTFGDSISGTGGFAQRGTGTTIFTGTNSYTGGTTIAQGTLQIGDGGTSGSITGDVFNNGTLAFNRSDAISFAGAISGTGNLVKLGTGTLTLNGQYSYTGATTINAGKLVVGDDSHGSASLASTVTVNNGGTLGGIGTIGGLNVAGGTVAPGNSIGTLNVAGNVSFSAGSIYQIEANAAGQSDRIVASGTATLAGGNVLALAQTGVYAPQTVYNVLTADGGVTGGFASISTSLIFLTPSLSYDPNDVFLTLSRNDTSLASVARTPNQIAVADALDASGQLTNPLMIAVLNQTAPGARQAFDALSGEVHASAQTAMLDDSRYLRDAVLGRLRQSSFAGSTGPMAALASGGPQIAEMDSLVASSALAYAGAERSGFPVKAPPPARLAPLPETTFWTQGVGAWGQLDGNGNAARMTRDLAGFFSGVDHRFATNWVAGLAGGYTSSTVRVSARSSSADIQTAHIAGYTGASYGALNLRGGAGASFSTLDTSRSIVFPGFVDAARARYDATTAQVFGEIGYGLALGNAALEPFAGLAYAHLDTDRFNETGGSGAAALVGARNNEDVGYTSLGARIATSFAVFGGMQLTPRASAAWQYAFGDVTPTAALTFQSLGTGFTVAGVPLARSTALVEGGLDLRVTPQASVGVAYVGQLGDRVQDHSVKANFSWKF